MAREIKFRAWNSLAKDYETGWSYPSNFNNDVFSADLPEGITIEQYTGIKDRNGGEIYEGDIVRGTGYDGAAVCGPVVWYRTGWYVGSVGEPLNVAALDYIDSPAIVGTIRQNPELLNGNGNG